MDAKIKDRLIKCLMLTTSEADGEALNAIRMANTMLKKLNLSWEQLLASGGHRVDPDVQRRSDSAARAWEEMRRQAEAQARQQRAYAEEQQRKHQEWQNRQRAYGANTGQRRGRASAQDDFGTAQQGYSKPDWDKIFGV